MGLEGNADAGEVVEAVEEFRVKREAEFGEGTKFYRVGGIACGEHSGGGGGGFGQWGGPFEYGDAETAMVEFEGEREADDAGSGDADIGALHKISLDGRGRGYSLGVQVCVSRSAIVISAAVMRPKIAEA